MPGPLSGLRIVEMAGIGPGPFAGMMLADHGAEVVRIERPGARNDPRDPTLRSRRSVFADLKSDEGRGLVHALCAGADGLIEGFRPGVMERLGLGPETLLAANPRLVYGRMTGWGQAGPKARQAGHDINYIALAGALHAFGRAGDKPTPPVNLVGDYGGGAMMLAYGMVCAMLAARATGQGQVVDCAMVDGAALLTGFIRGLVEQGLWRDERGVNLIDTGAHFYDTYETADGRFIALGAYEPQFHAELLRRLGLEDDPAFAARMDPAAWPCLKDKLAALFRTRTRDEWCALLEDSEACVAPVLSMAEAPGHPHNRAREVFVEVGATLQPAPAPRYQATPNDPPSPAGPAGGDTARVLAGLGWEPARITAYCEAMGAPAA